jgi:hypothetical protein
MRLTGWGWAVAVIVSFVIVGIPFAGQIAWLVLGVMGIYYFVTADFNLRDAIAGERAWIVLEFVMPNGEPGKMTFKYPFTLAECVEDLPEVQTKLRQTAIETVPPFAAAKFKSATCVMSVVDPTKPR